MWVCRVGGGGNKQGREVSQSWLLVGLAEKLVICRTDFIFWFSFFFFFVFAFSCAIKFQTQLLIMTEYLGKCNRKITG